MKENSKEKLIRESFRLYPERLREGEEERLSEVVAADFLGVEEENLSYTGNVFFQGKASRIDEKLLLQLRIEAQAEIPCSICNEATTIKIEVPSLCHSVELSAIQGAVFDCRDLLREAILLETPSFAECHGGNCPQRAQLGKYLKKTPIGQGAAEEPVHQPLKELL